MIVKLDNKNKKLHGILGLILNAFYFFVSVHYVITCHTTSVVWYFGLAGVFAIYVAYCYTFGVKWEIKHIQENQEKLDKLEKKIGSMEKKVTFLMRNYEGVLPEDVENYEDLSEREGFDPKTHERL